MGIGIMEAGRFGSQILLKFGVIRGPILGLSWIVGEINSRDYTTLSLEAGSSETVLDCPARAPVRFGGIYRNHTGSRKSKIANADRG